MKNIYKFIFFIHLSIYVYSLEPTLELHPKDTFSQEDNSKNVLQGIASYGEYIFTSQAIRKHKRDTAILFNLLDKTGQSIANNELPIRTHGYDLSIERIDKDHIYLYTVGEHSNNAIRFLITLPKSNFTNQNPTKLDIKFDKFIKLPKEYQASTGITLDEDKIYLLAISRKYIREQSRIKVISGHINIYDKRTLLNHDPKILYTIPMIKEQENEAVQGIVMNENIIYTLSGNNNPNEKKILITYHKNGSFYKKYYLMRPSNELRKWHKWELEGLTILNGYLVTTINAIESNSNIHRKYILKLLQL